MDKYYYSIYNEYNIDQRLIRDELSWDSRFVIFKGIKYMRYLKSKWFTYGMYRAFTLIFIVIIILLFIPLSIIFIANAKKLELNALESYRTLAVGVKKLLSPYLKNNVFYLYKPSFLVKSKEGFTLVQIWLKSILVFYTVVFKNFFLAGHAIHVIELVFFDYLLKHSFTNVKMIITTCHYDRWVTFLDASNRYSITLIQHGFIKLQENIPYRFKNIEKLTVHDEKSKKLFLNHIMNCTPEVVIEANKISFKKMKVSSDIVSVLLIGTPANPDIEIRVVETLSSFDDITLYIKPHPRHSNKIYHNLIAKFNFSRISIIDFNPDVDLAIGSESTLLFDYANNNYSTYQIISQFDNITKINEQLEVIRSIKK